MPGQGASSDRETSIDVVYDAARCMTQIHRKIETPSTSGGPQIVANQTTRHVCGEGGRRVLRATTDNLTGQKKRVIDFAGLAEIRPDEGIMLWRVPVNGAVMVEEARRLVDGARDPWQSGYLHTDIRGSTLVRADWSEQMSLPFEEAEYGAWGETFSVSDWDAPTHQFVGFEPDPATGWYYMGARVYDPALRRWLSPDPLLLAAPQVDALGGQELNLYSYVRNNPVGLIDPKGTLGTVAWGGSSGCTASQPDCKRGSTPYRGEQPDAGLVGKGLEYAVKGMLLLAVAPLADTASAVNEAANGNYGPAALSVGMAVVPVGRLKVLKTLGKRQRQLISRTKTADFHTLVGATKSTPLNNKGKVVQSTKSGGFAQAEADFDALTEGLDVTSFNGKFSGRTATLKDGRQLTSRNGSSTGPATLEMIEKGDQNKVIMKSKVRYDESVP